jgi:arylsulfatase
MLTRREFMQRTSQGLAATALTGALGNCATTQGGDPSRPNIVIVMADDMGISDLGCYGSEIHTPVLDSLAGDGLRFTQFYNVARCCPSRASLLTGLHPHQAGMGGMVNRPPAPLPEPGPYQGYLNDSCVTVAEALRASGYRTWMSGKWHVGERREHWPTERGFDRYFGFISGAGSFWEVLEEDRPRFMALEDQPYTPPDEDFYMTDAFSDYAVDRIDEHGDNADPFFLYLPHTAPHWPMHAWEEDIAKYRDRYHAGWEVLREERHARMLQLGIVDERWPMSPLDDEVPAWNSLSREARDDMALRMAVYAAMIDRMDQGIGKVVDALKRNGAYDNTLILFLCDNGGCHEMLKNHRLHTPGKKPGERGSFLSYQRGWANASNTPFRMFKHWVHEGGIASPLVAHWPKGIARPGTRTDQVGYIPDLMPTCLDLAGADYPETYNDRAVTPCEGKSLAPILRGQTRTPHEALYWEHSGNRAIRRGDYKLVAKKKGDWELYDLKADRTELTDLSVAQPQQAAALHDQWETWARRVGVKGV